MSSNFELCPEHFSLLYCVTLVLLNILKKSEARNQLTSQVQTMSLVSSFVGHGPYVSFVSEDFVMLYLTLLKVQCT